MRPDMYETNVRPDATASYLELNPEAPSRSSRGRGWEEVIVEREHFYPFENGDVTYDEILIGSIESKSVRMLHESDGRRFEGIYREGELVLSPAGQPVHWRLDDEADSLLLIVLPSLLKRVALETTEVDPAKVQLLACPRTRDPFLQHMIGSLIKEVEAPQIGETLHVESLTNLLAIHLLRRHSTLSRRIDIPGLRGLSGPRLGRAIEAIRANLETGVSLAEIAEAAGVSTSHFVTLFKRSTGLAPHQYLIRCRVERAQCLIRDGDESLSLAQIAAQAGFCDQGHLNRHFKRLVGVTPASYRKMQ